MRITQTQSGQGFNTTTRTQTEQPDMPFALDLEQGASNALDDDTLQLGDSAKSPPAGGTLSATLWNMSGIENGTAAPVETANPSTSTAVVSNSGTASLADSLADEFKKLVSMTPAERIRAQYLQSHHLTEAQFDALPQSQKDSVNQEIAKLVKEQLTGNDDRASSKNDSTHRTAQI